MTSETSTPRIARVMVDVPLAHLDRPFDYAIPGDLADVVRPGIRVRVPFSGRLRDGWVLEVVSASEVTGPLTPIAKVVSAEVVLPEAAAHLVRAVADHWGGTFGDVARLAVPPRHATTEKATPPSRPAPRLDGPTSVLGRYPLAEGFLDGLRAGRGLRAAWCPVPVHAPVGDGLGGILDAAAATLASGRGVVVVVPDADELAHLEARCAERFGEGSFVTLSADLGPAARYRSFLAVVRGDVPLVIGTRSAVFAPVHDLGLVAVWDEGNDLLAEPRAPYPHAREVAMLRAAQEHCGLLLAGYGRSAEVAALIERDWLVPLDLPAAEARRLGPAVRVAADTDRALERDPDAKRARLPHDVFAAIRVGLASGPVLLQVPRAGYAPRLACQKCHTIARCPACAHPLRGERSASGLGLICAQCGPLPGLWHCSECGDTRLRTPRVGVSRTAEELGRAFPQVKVVSSWSGHLVDAVDADPALVLAIPGAEPEPEAGYAAAVLLDTGLLLGRPDLRAAEEALRRWLSVCALVRSASEGGTVLAVGEPDARAIQALVRLDPMGFAARELAERAQTRFPPAAKLATVDGPREALAEAEGAWRPVPGVEHFGPVDLGDDVWRMTVRCPPAHGAELVEALRGFVAARSARKASGSVRVRVDPAVIG